MKINGKKIQSQNEEILVLPRPDGDIVLKARAVVDYDIFEKMYPEPEPPKIQMKGQTAWTPNYEAPEHKQALLKRGRARNCWMIAKSLQATEGLEYEVFSFEKPDTWLSIWDEFKNSGFTPAEVAHIIDAVYVANSLSEEKLEAARNRFLLSQAAKAESPRPSLSSQISGSTSTASGVPAKG